MGRCRWLGEGVCISTSEKAPGWMTKEKVGKGMNAAHRSNCRTVLDAICLKRSSITTCNVGF